MSFSFQSLSLNLTQYVPPIYPALPVLPGSIYYLYLISNQFSLSYIHIPCQVYVGHPQGVEKQAAGGRRDLLGRNLSQNRESLCEKALLAHIKTVFAKLDSRLG